MKLKSDTEVADNLKVSHTMISQIKNNKKELSFKTAKKMWEQAGDDIALMWGRLQEEKIKKG